MNRIGQTGWECAAMEDPAGRRGIWFRLTEDSGQLEICGGREGDDYYIVLTPGHPLTKAGLDNLHDLLDTARWSHEARVEGMEKGESR